MWPTVTPSARQCGPPELLATLPPIEQLCWLLGSGAKCRPCGGDVPGEVEVQHARLDPRQPVHRVDRQHAVHLRERDDHAHGRAGWHHRPGRCPRRGRRTARRGERRPAHARPAPRRSWSGSTTTPADTFDVRRVAPVQAELGRRRCAPGRRRARAQRVDSVGGERRRWPRRVCGRAVIGLARRCDRFGSSRTWRSTITWPGSTGTTVDQHRRRRRRARRPAVVSAAVAAGRAARAPSPPSRAAPSRTASATR